MGYKRVDEYTTLYLTDEEESENKEIIRNAGLNRLSILLNAKNMDEWDRITKELEYQVESGMNLKKTLDDYRTYIRRLITKLLE